MGELEHLVVYLRCDGFAMNDQSTFLLKLAVGPYIVVAGEEMYPDSHVGKLRELA